MGPHVVWFKRDLRITDHAPLTVAARHGPVVPLYVVEPALWRQPDASARQWAFVAESLHELRHELAELGQPLIVRVGDVVEILDDLYRRHGVDGLWSHEETGNGWTFARDRRVRDWARRRGVVWTERPQSGVIRGLRRRDGWAGRWETFMAGPPHPVPHGLSPVPDIDPGAIPDAVALGLAADPCPGRQRGGRSQGLAVLSEFLRSRGARYHRDLSSPTTATAGCSRLSPHLAYGTVSMREVVARTRDRLATIGRSSDEDREWRRALSAFQARLHWHCHFIQKLETEPRLEFANAHSAYDGLRESDFDPALFQAWRRGETGVPFVDACMRSLHETGWLNFRMRAMLVSFAAYQLWLHWREPALFLARQFVDYEPGIHYSQMQMQSGTTGINTIRIYNPVKQGYDHDATGRFIRRWVPELARVPERFIHEPWIMDRSAQDAAGCRLDRDYPAPVVDLTEAARTARDRVWAVRRQMHFRDEADRIQDRHGSRASGLPPTRRRKPPRGDAGQLSLDL